MKTIHFNTGRKYTTNGQRITATLHDDGIVTFYDHDRMIDGEFAMAAFPYAQDLTWAEVMAAYDGGIGLGTQRSFLDALPQGSVNSVWQGRAK